MSQFCDECSQELDTYCDECDEFYCSVCDDHSECELQASDPDNYPDEFDG